MESAFKTDKDSSEQLQAAREMGLNEQLHGLKGK